MAIEDVINRIAADDQLLTAGAILSRCLSLDGLIDPTVARAALSAAERRVCDCLAELDRTSSRTDGNFTIACRPHGRLHLLPRDEYEAHEPLLAFVRHFQLSDAETVSFKRARLEEAIHLEADRASLCRGLTSEGIRGIGGRVREVASHMAPLILHCGSVTISNFYSVGASGYPSEITLQDACDHLADFGADARIEVLTVLRCLDLLLSSGPPARLEEFNSGQITLALLQSAFDLKEASYLSVLPAQPASPHDGSLDGMASWLSEMRHLVAARHRFIRLINGTSLRKAEALLPEEGTASERSERRTRGIVERCLLRLFGDDRPASAEELFLSLPPQGSVFATSVEALIDAIIADAVDATDSEFGMTRGVRDFQAFFLSYVRGDAVTACGWGQDRYFCHVTASDGWRSASSRSALLANLNAMSARMRYNTWHYIPSYFADEDVPSSRPWFYAPRMADIADHSDQHHTGHKHAAVKFSIRSPSPIRMGETTLPGFIDLRLMRQTGRPYDLTAIRTAILYTEALRSVYQDVMDAVVGLRSVVPVFSFGNKYTFDRIHPSSVTSVVDGRAAVIQDVDAARQPPYAATGLEQGVNEIGAHP